MPTPNVRLSSFFLCAALVLSALSAQAQAQRTFPDDREIAYLRHHEWTCSRDGLTASALFFYHSDSPGIVARLLVETPGSRHVVLTKRVAVRHGRDRVTLMDDATGWWFEIVEENGIRAGGVHEYLQTALDWYEPGKGRSVTLHARSRGGLDFETEVALESDPREMIRAFVVALRETGLDESLREEIPEPLTEAIAFLDVAFEGHDMRNVVDLLALIASDAVSPWDYTGLGWDERERNYRRGTTVSHPAELSFTSRFGSIDARNPLGDQPLSLLEGEGVPGTGAE